MTGAAEHTTSTIQESDLGYGDALLRRNVEEAARLLGADGAMVYLLDPVDGMLHFAHDAGIANLEAQHLIRGLTLEQGVGMFGAAVSTRQVTVTGDYRRESRFTHSPVADRIAAIANMRSMAVAPLLVDDEPLGAIGAYSSRIDDFGEAEVALLRALADHAAIAIANQRLLERVRSQADELAHRLDAQQTLQQIAARITAIRDPGEVLQTIVDSARRLLGSDGAHLTFLQPDGVSLRPIVVSGETDDELRQWLEQMDFPVGGGINGLAAERFEAVATVDYLADDRIPHEAEDDEVARRMGLRGMAAAPLRAPDASILGTLAVSSETPREFTADELDLLQSLADQGAIAISNARLVEQLSRSEERYRFLVENAPDVIWSVNRRGVLTYVSDTAERLTGWSQEELTGRHFSVLVGEKYRDIARVRWRETRQRPHDRHEYRYDLLRRDGSYVPVEMTSTGTLTDGKFAGAHGVLRDVSEQVRLEVELRRHAGDLARLVETQRTMAAIAQQIAAIRDPHVVLQRTVDEAARLLGADGGRIDLVSNEPGVLEWSYGASEIDQPVDDAPPDAIVFINEGVSGRAFTEQRVVRTGDYRNDTSFRHAEAPDEFVVRHAINSVMAAPLIGEEGALGTLTVHSSRPDAFSEADAEVLSVLAGQATIAVTNARLYAELERRVETQASVAAISAEIAALRDPSAVVQRTVDEAKRLLDADAALINPVDATATQLGWAVAAAPADEPIDDVDVPVGAGISGLAFSEGRVVRTGDYLNDASFEHFEALDAYIARRGMTSVMTAPLASTDGPIGALTVQSRRRHAWSIEDEQILNLLADQAAIAITNARLYDELTQSEERYRFLVDNSPDMIWSTDDKGRFTFVSDAIRSLTGREPEDVIGQHTDVLTADESKPLVVATTSEMMEHPGMAGRMKIHIPHADGHLVAAEVIMLPTIVDGEVAGLHGSVRDVSERERLEASLREQSAKLAARIASQQRLLMINRELLATLEPAGVLDLVADGLKSVVDYDNLAMYRMETENDVLTPVLARERNAEAVLGFPIQRGAGLTWWTVEHRQPVLLNDALNDPRVVQIPGTPVEEEAIVIVPLIAGEDVVGAMNISRMGGTREFSEDDFELIQLFATQAAVAISNARLYEELRERADAQRTLAEIAAQIAGLHDPLTVIQRSVTEAARLLRADRAQVNLVSEARSQLDRPIAAAPTPPAEEDVVVPIGSGIAGRAAAEGVVCWTGDYLADESFPHDAGDARIAAQGIRSMMSAPLTGPDRLIGTITVQSSGHNVFNADDGVLLQLLADQVAIAVTNARLYEELEESERRYRHLVDNSPDIVWSIDAEGNFTFFSETLESRTGWKPEELLGRPFTVLTDPGTQAAALAAWHQLREDPEREQRVRLALPMANGQVSPAEVAMTGTVVDGKFAGAHGAVRDIGERERLERSLRRQAGELAAGRERANLARELHDSVTQALFSMGLTTRSLEMLLQRDPEAAKGKLTELRDLQRDALAEMRTLIFELRPSSLETDGLLQAIRTHAEAVQGRTGMSVEVRADPDPLEESGEARAPIEVEEAIYRVAQEALHNVVKHANARHALIALSRSAAGLRLEVSDDGVGFDPDQIPRGHLGVAGMRQRAEQLGGEFAVTSRPGEGSRVEVFMSSAAIEEVAARGADDDAGASAE
ncbi:MAG TPA: GAF domain-containing protein [Candidatus Limnocylindria bacterium]|nr:GAF domain-containing protein [Candidatus Limnocylindria bacterium]